jgi:hypothetical protein
MFYDILAFVAVYFVVGEAIIVFYALRCASTQTEVRTLNLALLFRMGLTFFYYYRTFSGPSDATTYYTFARYVGFHSDFWSFFQTGTQFIDNLSWLFYPLVSFFDNSYLMLYVPFSLIAFIGSILFYRTLSDLKATDDRIRILISFFLPNLIFWSSNLGKDSIMYFGITGLLYSLRNTSRINFSGLIGFGSVIFFVRPHIIGLLLISGMLGTFLQRNKMNFRTIAISVVFFASFLLLQDKIFSFVGMKIEKEDVETVQTGAMPDFEQYYSEGMRKISNMSSQYKGTGAEIQQPSKIRFLVAPYYFLAFISMPFLWQARNAIQLASAIESTIYQYFILVIILRWRSLIASTMLPLKYFWMFYLVITSIIFGMSTSNFGLGVRQKCMVLPVLILLYAITITKTQRSSPADPRKTQYVDGFFGKVKWSPAPTEKSG